MLARNPDRAAGENRLTIGVMALVLVFYIGLAFVQLDGLWESPSSVVLLPSPDDHRDFVLQSSDQWMVLATVTDNARRILDRPMSFRDSGACHPFPRAYTLGEHMWNGGLLAALPLAISGEPILAYNVMLLSLWYAAGLAMFAFVFFSTKSVGAALVAGLFFQLYRGNILHPYADANFWTPLALLFLYRLFQRGDWRSALGLAFFGAMQFGESLYPVLAAAFLIGTCAVFLGFQHRTVLVNRLPKLLFCAAVAAAAAWWVFGEYLATAETWSILGGRPVLGAAPYRFMPGARNGVLLFALAALGLLDRFRGARGGGTDPRLALFVGGSLVLWLATIYVPIPFSERGLPSLARLLQPVIPGLGAVRVISATLNGFFLALAALAGYGVLVLTERLPRRGRAIVALALASAILWERPTSAEPGFQPYVATLAPGDQALLRSLDGATVLDFPPRQGNMVAHAHYLRMAVEHGGRTAACYNSFASPMAADVAALALRLPARAPMKALAALGFEVVLVHADNLRGGPGPGFTPAQDTLFDGALVEIARSQHHAALALDPAGPVVSNWSVLTSSAALREFEKVRVFAPEPKVLFRFYNDTDETFLHPDPVEPSALEVRWFDRRGVERLATPVTDLLPIAIGPHDAGLRRYVLPAPDPPGEYIATLHRTEAPHTPIARTRVQVLPGRIGPTIEKGRATGPPPSARR